MSRQVSQILRCVPTLPPPGRPAVWLREMKTHLSLSDTVLEANDPLVYVFWYLTIPFQYPSLSVCPTMLSRLHHTLLYSSVSLLVAAFPAFGPESYHKCYFLDGSFDPAGGSCYGHVGASLCCYSGENCARKGLCLASPNGPGGQYDNDSSIWRRSCTDII